MSEGPFQRMWSRRPRRHVRRVATLEGKFPGQRKVGDDTNPQTPFVLSPSSRAAARRSRTTFVVDLTNKHLERIRSNDFEVIEDLEEDIDV